MSCVPVRFGTNNLAQGTTLTSTPLPVTPLDDLKNEHKARYARWADPVGDIVINGNFAASVVEYFALPGSNLLGKAAVRVQFYSDPNQGGTELYDSGAETLAGLLALGQWRVGIDGYNELVEATKPDMLLHWLDPIVAQSIRITVTPELNGAGNADLRMILFGEKLELETSFDYGNSISFTTPPRLARTASGSTVETGFQSLSRQMSLPLNRMTDNDRAEFSRMVIQLLGSPFIISGYPDRVGWQYDQYSFLARFPDVLRFVQTLDGMHKVTNLNLVEV